MNRKIIIVLGLIFVFAVAYACVEKEGDLSSEGQYVTEIKNNRQEKDSYLKTSDKSPILEAERENFEGLKYFEPNSEYRVDAKFVKYENPDTLKITTTKPDDIRTMLRFGEFIFKLDKKEYKLQGYVNVPVEYPVYVFIPFTDLTSGEETYEVGRYLDISMNDGETDFVLDFNTAYNPYCAYNNRYSCPLVPDENFLKTKISAGEKVYKSH